MNGFDLSTIQGCYVGSIPTSAIYMGSNLIWPTGPHDYSKDYLTFEVVNQGNLYFISRSSSATPLNFEYSKDDGVTWVSASTSTSPGTLLISETDPVGQKVLLRANNYSYGATGNTHKFVANSARGRFKVYGNIMSLVYYGDTVDWKTATSFPAGTSYTFASMFLNGAFESTAGWLTDVSNLILPATTLASSCYNSMFQGQKLITTAPKLPATSLISGCYDQMFSYCEALNHVEAMFLTKPESSFADSDTYNWLYDVASTGTFVKNANATWTDRGTYAVPTGWTIEQK